MTGFVIFGEEMFFLEIVLKTKYLFIVLGMWDCSSVVEHSNSVREVCGSITLAFFFIIVGLLVERL